MIAVDAPAPLVCPCCESRDVHALLWVALATGLVVEDGDAFETEYFCVRCNEGFRCPSIRCV